MGDKNKAASDPTTTNMLVGMKIIEETYLEWKAELAKAGKTPEDMIKLYRSLGMAEYAAELESFVLRMEVNLL